MNVSWRAQNWSTYDAIRSDTRSQPELWTAAAPVAFDVAQIGIKGSPTIVGRAYTPPPKKAGEMLAVSEKGLEASVAAVVARIGAVR